MRVFLQHQQDPGECFHKLLSAPHTWEQRPVLWLCWSVKDSVPLENELLLARLKAFKLSPNGTYLVEACMSTEGKILADSYSKVSQLCGTSEVAFLFLS